jgi:hypothetical protein
MASSVAGTLQIRCKYSRSTFILQATLRMTRLGEGRHGARPALSHAEPTPVQRDHQAFKKRQKFSVDKSKVIW